MLILDATTKKLQLKVAGTIPYTSHYVDITPTTFVPGCSDGYSSSSGPVAIVAAPAASTQRQIKAITVFNTTASALNIYVEISDNGTIYRLLGPSLQTNEMLQYIDTDGWKVMTADGIIKVG